MSTAAEQTGQPRVDADLGRLDYAPVRVGLSRRVVLRGAAIAAALLVLGLQVPTLIGSEYTLTVVTEGIVLAILALSIGFLAHHSGLVSLGHTAFYGTAAYLVAITTSRWGWDPTLAALLAIVGGTTLSVGIGALVVRTPGMGFLMLTLAFGQGLYQLCVQTNMRPVTGGYDGLLVEIPAGGDVLGLNTAGLAKASSFWPLAWCSVVVVAFVFWLVGRSRLGILLEAIRENEERARFSGYDTYLPRLAAFAVSGAAASVAGVLFALHSQFVSPDVLSFTTAGNSLIAAIVGGVALLAGPIVGAVLYVWAQSKLGSSGNLQLYTGLALVAVLAFVPGGLVGGPVNLVRRLRESLRRRRAGDG